MIYIFIINNERFKRYDDTYYVGEYGNIYSFYANKLLKHYITKDKYHRVDIHRKHIKVHKLVYLVWNGNIEDGLQILHKDDNKDNNHYSNLYLGTQSQNVSDCIKNGTRVGNITFLKILDKKLNKTIIFPNCKSFFEYCGRSYKNTSISHVVNKNWFNEGYKLIEKRSVETIESYNKLISNYLIENKAICRSE